MVKYKNLKAYIVSIVLALCVLSVLLPEMLIPAVASIAIILLMYFFNISRRTSLEEKKKEIEELLLLTIFFAIYSVYSLSASMHFSGYKTAAVFLIFALCFIVIDLLRGINIFRLPEGKEIYFRVGNPKSKNKIILLGDSIITNQGVHRPENSLGNLFVKDFPDSEITTIAKNGLTTKGLLKMMKDEKGQYDVAVISIGGNDIAAMVSIKKIKSNINKILSLSGKMAKQIIFIFSYDIGRAPFFSKTLLASIFSKYFSDRSERLIGALLELKKNKSFLLLNLNDPSVGQGKASKLYDIDSLHPNDKGYRHLYEQIVSLIEKKNNKH